MALKLNWKNPNTVPTKVRIYRGDVPIDLTALPTPLVELTEGELTWIDETVKFGSTYYYVLGVVTHNDLLLTNNHEVLVADNRGAGPSVLQTGNESLGYYGIVNQSEFISKADIIAAAITTVGLPTHTIHLVWHKFVRNGAVLYLPSSTLGVAKWVDLYHAGFVFGVDDVKHDESTPMQGITPTNQLRVIEHKGHRYKIRLLRKWGDGKDSDVGDWGRKSNDSIPNTVPNEHTDLVYPLIDFVPDKQRTTNIVSEILWDQIVGYPASWVDPSYTNHGRLIGQERRSSDGYVLARGERSWIQSNTSAPPHTVAHVASQDAMPPNVPCGWYPVLELINETTLKF